jgi:hypothetical protein
MQEMYCSCCIIKDRRYKVLAKNYPPFMNATGAIGKILEKIKVAATPERFTQDFLELWSKVVFGIRIKRRPDRRQLPRHHL